MPNDPGSLWGEGGGLPLQLTSRHRVHSSHQEDAVQGIFHCLPDALNVSNMSDAASIRAVKWLAFFSMSCDQQAVFVFDSSSHIHGFPDLVISVLCFCTPAFLKEHV